MAIERVYKLTNLGKRKAGSMSPSKRNLILDHLYRSKGRSSTTTELSYVTGLTEGAVLTELKKLQRSGYVLNMSADPF